MPAKLLTDVTIEKLKPDPEKRVEIPDRLQPGLFLVIQPSGRRSFAVRTRLDGKPIKVTIGNVGVVSLAEARQKAADHIKAAQRGEDPRIEPEAPKVTTVSEAVDEFIARYAKPRLRSWRDVENRLKRDLVRLYANRPIRDLARVDIVRMLDEMSDRGLAQGANRGLAHTRKFLAWCVERGLIDASPAGGIKPPARETTRDRVLGDNEVAAIWTACDGLGFPFGPLIRFMLVTAQREGECAGMRWSHVDLDRRLWTLPRDETKNGREHCVPLSDLAIEVLASVPRLHAGSDALTFSTTGATPPSGWSGAKERLDRSIARARAADRLGRGLQPGEKPADGTGVDGITDFLSPWRFHDLRRTAASAMAELGHPPHVVAAVLNHAPGSTQGVTAIYNRFRYDDEKRAALDSCARRISRICGMENSNVVLIPRTPCTAAL